MSVARERLLKILAEHRLYASPWRCYCGAKPPLEGSTDWWHDAHVADLVLAEGVLPDARPSEPSLPKEIVMTETQEDLVEAAWGIIANAGQGDWDREHPDWKAAAERWRDRYHATLPKVDGVDFPTRERE